MLAVWQEPPWRPTMDIDLLGRNISNDVEAMRAVTRDVCSQQVERDGVVSDPKTIQAERVIEGADYEGVRLRFWAVLGTARVRMQLDVAFGDVVVPRAGRVEYPTILDMPAPRLRGYSKDSLIAEKFQAMVSLGLLNSRMKDFFDIWLLSRQFDFHGGTLATAIAKTFAKRRTVLAPDAPALSAAFAADASKGAQWRAFVRRSRLDNAPADFAAVIAGVAAFLGPIAQAVAAHRSFDGSWKAPGPWLPQPAAEQA